MSHTLTEGGQITTHRLRMFRQVIKSTLLGIFFLSLCIFAFKIYAIPKIAYQSLWYQSKAIILEGIFEKIEVNREFASLILKVNFVENPELATQQVIQITSKMAHITLQFLFSSMLQSFLISGMFGLGILAFFFYRGRLAKSQKHLSGSKISSCWKTALRLKISRKASNIKIGNVPLVKGTETQHILISGGTGSGKTNCLHHILKQIRAHKQKAIIVDTTGVFVEKYFRQGKDIILNPFEPRGAAWSPWAEGSTSADYASLAEAFIPASSSDHENYWRLASKTVFTSILDQYADKKMISAICHAMQYEKLAVLCQLLEGTKAAAHMDISSEKTASSVRSVASTYLECLGCLKDTSNPFSIREWIKENNDSWLFLQCTPSERALMRPLITAWISSAIRGLLSLPIDLKRRVWFSIDELPTLQKVKDLETLLTEGRKYGGCAILSLQSPAQIESIYGRENARVIIGNTATPRPRRLRYGDQTRRSPRGSSGRDESPLSWPP